MYAATCEELYEKQLEARRQVEEIVFHRQHPTVAEYCEKWLLMQSAKVTAATLRGYTADMKNYIIKPLGESTAVLQAVILWNFSPAISRTIIQMQEYGLRRFSCGVFVCFLKKISRYLSE